MTKSFLAQFLWIEDRGNYNSRLNFRAMKAQTSNFKGTKFPYQLGW